MRGEAAGGVRRIVALPRSGLIIKAMSLDAATITCDIETAPLPLCADPRAWQRLNCSQEDIAKVCLEFQVEELAIFGSILRDDFDVRRSDVDFLYVFLPDNTNGLIELFQFREQLAALVKRKVDVLSKKWMGSDYEKSILPVAKLIYAKR